MEDDTDKQSEIAVENADIALNDVDLSASCSSENRVPYGTTDAANEGVAVMASLAVDGTTQEDESLSRESVPNDVQSDIDNVAITVQAKSHLRKRAVRQPAVVSDTETPAKRRRVQHNYRRLSSSGYVDDYDGRERFSGKQTTAPAGNRQSPSKSKSVDSAPEHKSRFSASKTTRSQSEMDTSVVHGQSMIIRSG